MTLHFFIADETVGSDVFDSPHPVVQTPASTEGAQSDKAPKMLLNAQAQTDEFVVFPYEHLFPSVMPHFLTVT